MINWINGQTDRFKCLVVHDGNIDERMAYYDTEELWFPEWENGGTPWTAKNFGHHNPIDYVKNWKTPTLVIHGQKDYRVVYAHGLSTFTALQRTRDPQQAPHLPRRESLGPEARELPPVARHGARLARGVAEEVTG